jgi:flagellar biosynthesis/type III secretory pathway chaperone
MLKPLISTFEEIVSIQEQLVNVSDRKKDILVAGNIDSLSKLIQEESKLVRKLGKLEEERIFQMKEYLGSRGIHTEELTLSQLLQIIPTKADQVQIQALAEKLQQTIKRLQEQNELNAKLIQDSLNYVNHSIDLMTDQSKETINYQRPVGNLKASSSSGRSFFDTKA